MLKAILDNPVSGSIAALMVALLAAMAAFGLYVSSPESFGEPGFLVEPDSVYYLADSWTVNYDYLKISFSPGTLVIPGYNQDRVTAVLLIPPPDSPGNFVFSFPEEFRGELPDKLEDSMGQALLIINYNDFRTIIRDSGDTILLRVDDVDVPIRYLMREFEQSNSILTHYRFFGMVNYLQPQAKTVLLQLDGNRTGLLNYYEDTVVRLEGLDIDLEFNHPDLERRFYPPAGFLPRIGAYMVLLTLAAAAMTMVATAGHPSEQRRVMGEYNPLWTVAALLTAFIYSWLMVLYQSLFQTSDLWMAVLWALPLTLVAVWAVQSRLEPTFFGIQKEGTTLAVSLAAILTVFLLIGSAYRFPQGIDWNTGAFVAIMAACLFREALLRGFCQRILSHWLNPWLAVLLVAAIWTAAVVISQLPLASGESLALYVLGTLGKALLLGLVYHRTRHIMAPGLLAGFLEFFSSHLLY